MNQQIQIDYLQLSELIDDYQLDITAAELHGLITGSVCTTYSGTSETNWLDLITPYDALNEQQLGHLNHNLRIFYDLTMQELDSQMFEFNPALPDEDSSNEFRTQELAAWCRGFLTAYRQHVNQGQDLGEDASEALEDMAEIAFAVVGEGQDEEYEQALTELQEYLRISVQVIFDDLNPTQILH